MTREKVLIIDDDEDVRELLDIHLTEAGFHVIKVSDGTKALNYSQTYSPHLVILDLMMPGLDGYDVCLELRKLSDVPIILLSAKNDAAAKIMGLRLGADDYVTKPFNMGELIARVKAQLRRSRLMYEETGFPIGTGKPRALQFPGMEINLTSCHVRIEGRSIPLSAKEYQLLTFLAKNPGRVYTLEQLFLKVWDSSGYGDKRTVMVHISNLRKKIEPNSLKPQYIITVRGLGYMFNAFENIDHAFSR